MSKTRVVHVNDNVPGAVYIGRENGRKRLKRSRWHNPYVIGKPASHWIQADPITREGAIAAYALDMLDGPKQYLLAELPELRGKALACWCRHDGVPMTNGSNGPDNRCHGDWLVHMLNTHTDDELRSMAKGEGDGA